MEPDNPYLTDVSDGEAPSQAVVDTYRSEVEAAQLRAADAIAAGHAFEKHANGIGASSTADFAEIARQIISSPFRQVRDLARGRTGFYDAARNIAVFVDPASRDGGTMFEATQEYFNKQEGH